jgi:hypothetical protein
LSTGYLKSIACFPDRFSLLYRGKTHVGESPSDETFSKGRNSHFNSMKNASKKITKKNK